MSASDTQTAPEVTKDPQRKKLDHQVNMFGGIVLNIFLLPVAVLGYLGLNRTLPSAPDLENGDVFAALAIWLVASVPVGLAVKSSVAKAVRGRRKTVATSVIAGSLVSHPAVMALAFFVVSGFESAGALLGAVLGAIVSVADILMTGAWQADDATFEEIRQGRRR